MTLCVSGVRVHWQKAGRARPEAEARQAGVWEHGDAGAADTVGPAGCYQAFGPAPGDRRSHRRVEDHSGCLPPGEGGPSKAVVIQPEVMANWGL